MLRRLVLFCTLAVTISFAVILWVEGVFSGHLPLRVELGARSVSKAPFLIAADQGLFEKYGVRVDLRMPPPDFEGGIGERGMTRRALDFVLRRYQVRDMSANGITPDMVEMVTNLDHPRMVALASTDCILRNHIVARHGINSLEELKGKRIGVTGLLHNITGYAALELAKRMGWDPVHDISIILNGETVRALRAGRVDAIVASEREYAEALRHGFPVLLNTRTWGDLPVGGNSLQVGVSWLEDEVNREAARRFLKALIEGIALFHANRELTIAVLQRWHGVTREYAEVMYDHAAIPPKPYPCYDGIRRTMEVFDSHAMRAHRPEDFYDDRLVKELDASGFIDGVYAAVKTRTPASTQR